MRQKKCKAIKKAIYGNESPRHRNYTKMEKVSPEGEKYFNGTILCDDKRTFYQAMKKLYSKGVRFENI